MQINSTDRRTEKHRLSQSETTQHNWREWSFVTCPVNHDDYITAGGGGARTQWKIIITKAAQQTHNLNKTILAVAANTTVMVLMTDLARSLILCRNSSAYTIHICSLKFYSCMRGWIAQVVRHHLTAPPDITITACDHGRLQCSSWPNTGQP